MTRVGRVFLMLIDISFQEILNQYRLQTLQKVVMKDT